MPFPAKNAIAKRPRVCFPNVMLIIKMVLFQDNRIPAAVVQGVRVPAAVINKSEGNYDGL
jgi:hypothetical protein